MKIAYIVLAHREFGQVERLVRRLYGASCRVFLHVDRKVPPAQRQALQAALQDLPELVYVEPLPVYWADFSIVAATLRALEAVAASGEAFDYTCLLSGQDYPLATPEGIAAFLARHRGQSFLEFFRVPRPGWAGDGGMGRLERYHHRAEYSRSYGRAVALLARCVLHLLPRRTFFKDLQPYAGSQFWCLAQPCVEYVLEYVRRRPEYVQYFRHVKIPDEMFFQTMLVNSPLRETLVNDSLRYIDWSRPPYPAVLTHEDFPLLQQSGKLFARKFDLRLDAEVLDRIDRVLLRQNEATPVQRRDCI